MKTSKPLAVIFACMLSVSVSACPGSSGNDILISEPVEDPTGESIVDEVTGWLGDLFSLTL